MLTRSLSIVWSTVSSLPARQRAGQLRFVLLFMGVLVIGSGAWAETNLRSSFPGRRVGGGTRGECTARLVANLVPKSNVFAPGAAGLIAILQGPSANLHPLAVSFRSANAAGVVDPGAPPLAGLEMPAAPAGIVLVKAPALSGNTLWESSYRCENGSADSDPLSFVSAGAPPAVSLLVKVGDPADRVVQAKLVQLKVHCGGSIAKEQIARDFALEEALSSDWPSQLPVRCL